VTAFILTIAGANPAESPGTVGDILDSLPAQPRIAEGPFGNFEHFLVSAVRNYVAGKAGEGQKVDVDLQLIVNRCSAVTPTGDEAKPNPGESIGPGTASN
jgi:hypothetical protein